MDLKVAPQPRRINMLTQTTGRISNSEQLFLRAPDLAHEWLYNISERKVGAPCGIGKFEIDTQPAGSGPRSYWSQSRNGVRIVIEGRGIS
jgi:hypothetical protein